MKIQCDCGAKYAFDITPDMAASPISFICPQCGVDSSAIVNQLIRESLGSTSVPGAAAVIPSPPTVVPPAVAKAPIRISTGQNFSAPMASAVPSHAPAVPEKGALRVAGASTSASSVAEAVAASAAGEGPKPCHKHHGQFAQEHCVVCQKPICPKCMEMFGYVCSAFCRGKAESNRIYVPPYAGQKAVAEARYWRKSGLIFGAIVLSIGAVVGGISWYKWFGSVPSVAFSVKMPDKAYSGSCRIVGKDQVVFLHGGLIARHDMKSKKEVWSRQLIDRDQIARDAVKALEKEVEDRKKALNEGIIINSPPPTEEELKEDMLRSAQAALSLYVANGYAWVATPEKLVKYDWQTGQPGKEVMLEERFYEKEQRGDELVLTAFDDEGEKVTKRVNLQTGEMQIEQRPKAALASATTNAPGSRLQAGATGGRGVRGGNASAATGAQTGEKPLNPAAVASAAQNLPLPSRIALPAVLSANRSQQRLMAEMREMDEIPRGAPGKGRSPEFRTTYILDGTEKIEMSVALLEEKKIARQAMKAPPKKSVLDGDLRVTQTTELANEIFNDMQRDRTGGVEVEDASRYSVRVKRGEGEWAGEVTGYPSLFPLQIRDVLAADKKIIILDKQAKKMWESPLSHNLRNSLWKGPDDKPSAYGAGPCIEKGDTLYIVDEAVITAFEAGTGNARWRLPTVGVLGLHFDDEGMLYVNTTTASPEKLKYSQQIDISDRVHDQILKVDGRTGKTIWSAANEGLVNYLSGKFIYAISSYEGDEMDEGNPLAGIPGATTAPHVRIKRLNPKNGRVMWEHYQRRAPIDIQIDKTTIQILFRTEMQVLKYLTL